MEAAEGCSHEMTDVGCPNLEFQKLLPQGKKKVKEQQQFGPVSLVRTPVVPRTIGLFLVQTALAPSFTQWNPNMSLEQTEVDGWQKKLYDLKSYRVLSTFCLISALKIF